MQPEDKVRLQHILDEAIEACKYAEDLSFDEFLKDGKTARAIIENLPPLIKKINTIIRDQISGPLFNPYRGSTSINIKSSYQPSGFFLRGNLQACEVFCETGRIF